MIPAAGKIETFVVGSNHYRGSLRLIRQIRAGQTLALIRNPANPADPNAVKVHALGYMIGHVPRREAYYISKIMDAGARWTCSATKSGFSSLAFRWSASQPISLSGVLSEPEDQR